MIYGIMVYGVIMAAMTLAAYRMGLRDGGGETKPVIAVKKVVKPPKQTEEAKRQNAIWDNIQNYNGTGAGQRKVN